MFALAWFLAVYLRAARARGVVVYHLRAQELPQ